jgi:FSR family fosmidomycin resistance protein-like MFS transporter
MGRIYTTQEGRILNSHLRRYLYPIALAHLTIELCNNYLPILYPILITSMGLAYAQVGLVTLVGTTGTTLSQPFFGYVSDRWEARRIVVLSILWIGLLMGLVGLTRSYWSLILLVGLGSLGSAAFHPAGATLAAASTSTRRGATLSVFSVAGTLGSALSPLLITAAITWLGLPGTTLLVPAALVVGLLLYRQWGWASRSPTLAPASRQPKAHNLARAQQGSLIALILVVLMVMCRSWFQLSLSTYLPEWMQGQGWSLAAGGRMLTAFLVTVSLGTLLGGTLSDRIGRWQVVALSLALLGPTYWVFMLASGSAQVGLVGLVGLLLGSTFPVTVVMAQEAWPQGVGLASALVMGLGWLPGGLGASVTGLVADHSSLGGALQLLVIPPILGLVCALIYARHQRAVDRHMRETPSPAS